MPQGIMCNCSEQPVLIDITDGHSEFKSKLDQVDVGNWVLLMQCPDCGQHYKVDEWDKYQTCYAVKLSSTDDWESVDTESLIKTKIIENRGGLTNDLCMWSGCNLKQVKGSAFCVNHLYSTGARA